MQLLFLFVILFLILLHFWLLLNPRRLCLLLFLALILIAVIAVGGVCNTVDTETWRLIIRLNFSIFNFSFLLHCFHVLSMLILNNLLLLNFVLLWNMLLFFSNDYLLLLLLLIVNYLHIRRLSSIHSHIFLLHFSAEIILSYKLLP